MVNLPNNLSPLPQIQLVVNPVAGLADAALEITSQQAEALVVPVLVAQGLDVVVRCLDDPELEKIVETKGQIYPLTLAWNWGNAQVAELFEQCRQPRQIQKVVAEKGFLTGPGNYWLPVALTEKGLLYGELIGQGQDGHYLQPIHVEDKIRQPLYYLSQYLFKQLHVPLRGCCFLQVGWIQGELCFDRLWPFPIQPALASLGVQSPDLFYAHYLCCQGLPLKDLRIKGQAPYGELADLS
ncbi:hypothetical protein [Synechococcus sp. PCC 6312]|uniref:hypothetical protein n=1 Tax=Synechococcus sp. (strain ATCC 27167 / PCC 6312) TaxID=195253 RepID=UPI00029F32CC|nr:hypothetical protein [Synechococcus sp. PCC 6312]AFY59311.1 hypothetical protein Syn6312_0055 [Synechococcus sp. PCC 6312]